MNKTRVLFPDIENFRGRVDFERIIMVWELLNLGFCLVKHLSKPRTWDLGEEISIAYTDLK